MLALLVLAGVAVAERPAQAQGCHVADRPVFGLSSDWDVPRATDPPTASPPKVGRPPCSQEIPGSLQNISPLGAVGLTAPPVPMDAPTPAHRLIPTAPARPEQPTPDAPDRPPRPLCAGEF